MRNTKYAAELKTAAVGDARIEKLFIKSHQQEEIRVSWWPMGNLANRPLDIPEDLFIELLAKGVREGVLSPGFMFKLMDAIARE
jgi:hypothetical protein